MSDWTTLPDLASRRYGGTVMWANDESFAERENLITAAPPEFRPATFGRKGQVYDGWETRRRRSPGDDAAVIRLGMPGVISTVVVDTAFFTGNYPPECTVSACAASGYPAVEELLEWDEIVPRSPISGDTRNLFEVSSTTRYTHLRLTIHPDGGVARLRAHGEPVPDPALLDPGAIDLAALEFGARVVDCSNKFYSNPDNLLSPGQALSMGDGWETARRRDTGNDWVIVRLAAEGTVRFAELDTTHFKGNAPGWASLTGAPAEDGPWSPLLEHTRLQPDTRHRLPITTTAPVAYVRLDIHPDGGMARLRLHGSLTDTGRTAVETRFLDTR